MILIKGGTIVTSNKIFTGDILVEGEKIKKIDRSIKSEGQSLIDARRLFVFPGLVDAHVHFRDPGETHKEDFYTGTCAALASGVTTVIDMPNNKIPVSTLSRLSEKLRIAEKKAVCDYQLLFGATADNQEKAAKAAKKIAGLKIYFGSSTGDLLLYETEPVLKHFKNFPKNRMITVHAEDERIIRFYSKTSPWKHHLNRPPLAAISAVTKVIDFARTSNRSVHIAHFSTAAELELIKEAKSEGVKVTCEVTPHYLFLDLGFHLRKKNLGKMNPPLREKEDLAKIWKNFNYIDAIATDHAPHTLGEKLRDYPNSPSGVVGMETALPLLLTAYHEGRLKLQDIAIKYAQNPAKIYRLKNKGRIEEGLDADFCLVDLNKSYVVRNKDLKSKCAWTPFDGRRVKGKVVSTILRGRLVYQNGKILAPQGFGRLVSLS